MRYIPPMPRKIAIVVASILVCFVIISGLIGLAAYTFSERPFMAPQQPPVSFQLLDRDQPFDFPAKAQKLNLFYFGYTNCPDVCPLTLTYLGQAIRSLPESSQQNIQVIFVSVDHEHDTPETAAKFARTFFPSFKGFTGTKEQIDTLIKQFHGAYVIEKNEKSYLGYSISHSDRTFFVDQKGNILTSLSHVQSVEPLLQTIKENL